MSPRKKLDEVDRLYKAVAAYVKSRGGDVVVIGGIQIQQWPGTNDLNWTLGIPCTGRKPKFVGTEKEGE